MVDYRETHVVKEESDKSRASPWLAFAVGALLIAVIALFFVNVHISSNGPAGSVNVNVKPPVTPPATPAPAPAN